MHPFTYLRPVTIDEALVFVAKPGSLPLGGGTDLLVTMQEEIERPSALVDVRQLPGAREILVRADGSVRIGAAVRISDIASHAVVRAQFRALAEAAQVVGTPALRNMGTIAGNLCQRPRCWYLRRGIECLKSNGTRNAKPRSTPGVDSGGDCPARTGENHHHAIFDSGTCRAVHPSDPAVALAALDATVHVVGPAEVRRTLTIDALFAGAANRATRETAISDDELIEAIELPALSGGGTQRYRKIMQRGAWDFALVSLAGVKRTDGDVRLVLGGVSIAPYRVNQSVEEDVASGRLDAESVDALSERALYDAEPLSMNGYKVTQCKALLREIIDELANLS